MAEQLVNEFTVNRPIDEAWAVITDVERIAPCLPGAQLPGDRGRHLPRCRQDQARLDHAPVQGPGVVHRARRLRPHRDAQGRGARHRRSRQRGRRDRRQGREPVADVDAGDRHHRPAHHRQGRAVRSRDHRRRLQEADGAVRGEPEHDARRRSGAGGGGRGGAGHRRHRHHRRVEDGAPRPTLRRPPRCRHEAPKIRKIDSPASEPVDLAGMAGPAVLKRLLPVVGGLLLLLLILRRRKKS